ncbi:MAG: ornithine--oxo-acid transaminase, partial [Microbacteriaceae bacterium]|nr:ornithine--oxo-acid transaminase [Microbacteriaceae bacterium]
STFGGNPLAAAVGRAVVGMLATGEPQRRARELGTVLERRLSALTGHGVTAVRVRGLWAGVDIDPSVGTARQVCERMMAAGVLAKDTHGQTVRFAPPIVIDEADLERALDVFEAALTGARV